MRPFRVRVIHLSAVLFEVCVLVLCYKERNADGQNMNNYAPARVCITVNSIEYSLGNSFEQVFRFLYAKRSSQLGRHKIAI